jgi:acyl-coenzyme A thioesterase PaaI-like protein
MVKFPIVTLNTDLTEGHCFGCGQNNPAGLKLVFTRNKDVVKTVYRPAPLFQGWPGLLHGGITGTLLDEAMSHAAYATGNTCLTAESTLRIRQPIPLDAELVVTARITRRRRKVIETEGRICLSDGTILAESTAKQFIVENAREDVVGEKKHHV